MPSAQFDRTLDVGSSPAECWTVLTDVATVGGWVSVVESVTEHARLESYSAELADSFGPFKLRADVDLTVTEVEEERSIRFTGHGQDRQVGTTIDLDATMRLEPVDSGTRIVVTGQWNVLGTVAAMGTSTIKKKAETIMEEFFTAAETALG